jgi:hypothetical protein
MTLSIREGQELWSLFSMPYRQESFRFPVRLRQGLLINRSRFNF